MAIEIRETFQVGAPIDVVWRFMMDPQKVVACMPGAELEEVVDDRTFRGNVKVKVGAITTRYAGRVHLAMVDKQGYAVQMVAEGRETSGGTAKGSVTSRLRPLPSGRTEVAAEASIDLTGRIMQVGRGMIQGVSQQLFQQFVTSTKRHLEVPEGTAVPVHEPRAIRIVPLLLQAFWAAVLRALRRLRRPPRASMPS